ARRRRRLQEGAGRGRPLQVRLLHSRGGADPGGQRDVLAQDAEREGALELGASGDISLAGNVIATGGSGGSNRGGGAAGGAILVHGTSATLSGSLNASGGAGIAFSGGGGGGRVLILTGSGALDAGSLAANVNVSGGTAG